MMTSSAAEPGYDLAVLGAGPAGLAAAVRAATAGARVVLIDAGAHPGGQYWRHRGPADSGALHHDWRTFQTLRDSLPGRVEHLARHTVWQVGRYEHGLEIHTVHEGTAHGGSSDTVHRRGAGEGTVGDNTVCRGATCDEPAREGTLCGDAGRGDPLRGDATPDHPTRCDTERCLRVAALVVATGAYDRQLPFPGWTLPGVYTAGGVQSLLKGHGVLAGRRIAVAGTGPFLLAVAAGLAESGAEVAGVFEAGHPAGFARFPGALAVNAAKLAEGAGFLATMARHRIPYHPRTTVLAAHGKGELSGITTARLTRWGKLVPGSESEVDCDTLAVGYGFTPQLEIPLQLGCETRLDEDGSLVAVADHRQRSTGDRVYLAGEVCGVAGAAASVVEGHLAGIAAVEDILGIAPDPRELRGLLRQRRARRAFARAMHRTFPVPPGWTDRLTPATVVCRCEEVDAATIAAAATELGATDPRAVKLYARPGMGLCQGRVCGYATSCLTAARENRTPTAEELRSLAARPIASPVTLGMLAKGDRSPGE
ncbi:NADP-dependent aldehyde dehydrogenase [Amycolatopsis sulphurea]|uniref:NADP-dependent aldehyde dehydrogenase n=1 Tax=Amycolatopsis sulphurea TaxID=76022 RepID=A0A2A9FHJ1_9PSEU|nr:FAD-dependent oxidoreductase [Amycolatopsis sulphurea]PFG50618.1 NADP-dependent aldehyde dehydrogenase [Amycolatopsis sulphurea]